MGCANTKVPAEYNEVAIVQNKVLSPSQTTTEQDKEDNEEESNLNEINEMIQHYMIVNQSKNKLIYEKYGIQKTIDVYQSKLLQLTEEQTNSKNKYTNLLNKVVEQDVNDVYHALTSSQVDKRVLINILTARPKWHIAMISEQYERDYSIPLFRQIRENLTTQFGRLTGSKTDLARLLQLITADQPERDAKLLKNSVNDIEVILEVCFFLFSRFSFLR